MNNITAEARRAFAERIIAGEYKTVTCLLECEDGTFETWWDGSCVSTLGMMELMKHNILKSSERREEEEE